jgi:hypothetical protein
MAKKTEGTSRNIKILLIKGDVSRFKGKKVMPRTTLFLTDYRRQSDGNHEIKLYINFVDRKLQTNSENEVYDLYPLITPGSFELANRILHLPGSPRA